MRRYISYILVLAALSLASLCLGLGHYDLLYELVLQGHQPYISMDLMGKCMFLFGKVFVVIFHVVIPALIFFFSVNKGLDLFWTGVLCLAGCLLAHMLGILSPFGLLIALPFVLLGKVFKAFFR